MSSSYDADNARYGHILSRKSVSLKRDTFFFANRQFMMELLLGVNQKLTPMTCARLNRWLNVLSACNGPLEVVVCAVEVEVAGVMGYIMKPSGAFFDYESSEPLPPGNYGIYFNRIRTVSPRLTYARHHRCNFWMRFSKDWPEITRETMDPIPQSVEHAVNARDSRRCLITGVVEDVSLVFVVPPVLAWETDDYSHPETFDHTPFLSAANVLTLREDLIYFFHSNHFGVDVDDEHRIVVLAPIGGLEQDLPTHLPLLAHDRAMDEFLRLHFRFSLSVQLRGGDIRDDYPPGRILAMMDELGVPHAMTENPEESVMATLGDARWQNVLGRAILADTVKHQVTQSFRCNNSVDEDAEDDRYGSQDGISSGGESEDRESEEDSDSS